MYSGRVDLPRSSGSMSIAKFAKSVIDSLVEVTGLEFSVEVADVTLDKDGDMGGSEESMGRLGDGGEDRLDGGGVSKPVVSSASSNARRSPVDRLKDNGLRSGDDSPLEPARRTGDCDPAAMGVVSPSVEA